MNDMLKRLPTLGRTETAILEMLCSRSGELYGLEMVAMSGGRIKRGTIYVILNRMEDKGYIVSRQEEANPKERGIPKRLYKPTGLGERALAAWHSATQAFNGGDYGLTTGFH